MDSVGPTGGAADEGSIVPENGSFFNPLAVRAGLKRELAFALKSQAELSETLGRTRLRKPPSSPFPAATPLASTPDMKKRGRGNSIEFFSSDFRILKERPALEKSPTRVPVLAHQAASHTGFSVDTPIVVDDVDVAGRATDNATIGGGTGPGSMPLHTPDLIVPGWLEQQVSRITQAGSKYVMQGMEAGVFDGSGEGTTNFDSSNTNTSTRLSSPESVLDSIESTSRDTSRGRTGGKITRKDVRLHKLVFMEDILPEGTMLRYVVNGSPKLVGYAKDSAIYCTCCKNVVSPSQFEAHAGQAQRRKPYNYIYTSNGVSLHELSVTLSKHRKLLDNENDDLCSICEDAGELILCDLCPRAFHQACAGLSSVPEGNWHCSYCQNMHKRESYVVYNDNARAAGRVPGVDAIDQILKRSSLNFLPNSRVGGCALCRSKDYDESGFGQLTVLLCDQCDKEYHVGCLKNYGRDDLKEKPQGDWFCCADCITIHTALQDVLSHGAQALDPVLDVIKRNNREEISIKNANDNLKWRLFRGNTASANDKLFLSSALSILHESFVPMIDGRKGDDFVAQMIFGTSWGQKDFQGMYSAILTVDSSVVSVIILRIWGCEAAEIPLVATRNECQGQGYFGALFGCIGKLLADLNVKHLVLASTEETEAMWRRRYGFRKISMSQMDELAQGINILEFQGTTLLHTTVSELVLDVFGGQGR